MGAAQANSDAVALLRKTAELSPIFSRRSTNATAARRLDPYTVVQMREAGLLQVYVPKRFGGDELHMVDV